MAETTVVCGSLASPPLPDHLVDVDHTITIPAATAGGPSNPKTATCSCGWTSTARWNPLAEDINRHLWAVENKTNRRSVTVP